MDEGYVKRLETELYAAQVIFDKAAADRHQARKVLAKAEETYSLSQAKVDSIKTMLISALKVE